MPSYSSTANAAGAHIAEDSAVVYLHAVQPVWYTVLPRIATLQNTAATAAMPGQQQ